MDLDIRWIVSQSANSLYAAAAVCCGRRAAGVAADPRLTEAVAEPARLLASEIGLLGLDEQRVWQHLLPLSAAIENNRELAEAVVRKAAGSAAAAGSAVGQLAGRIADVEAAARRLLPDLVDMVTEWARPLNEAWEGQRANLLGRAAYLTDERIVPAGADVLAVWGVFGGGSAAYIPYNRLFIEVGPSAEPPEIPEVVRLAWLLSQLNLDLPALSENIARDRLSLVASVATLPAVLAAAGEFEATAPDPAMLRKTLRSWQVVGPEGLDLSDVVLTWWATYVESRPPWHVALAALDRMLTP